MKRSGLNPPLRDQIRLRAAAGGIGQRWAAATPAPRRSRREENNRQRSQTRAPFAVARPARDAGADDVDV